MDVTNVFRVCTNGSGTENWLFGVYRGCWSCVSCSIGVGYVDVLCVCYECYVHKANIYAHKGKQRVVCGGWTYGL